MTDIIILRQTRCEVHNCLTCGVVYTIPEVVIENHRKHGGYHHCPNGHSQGWSKEQSQDEKTRRERDRLKQENARLEQEAAEALAQAEKAQAALARHKKRSAAGTCPCCSRTFRQLAAHMKTKHPEWAKKAGANVVSLKAVQA